MFKHTYLFIDNMYIRIVGGGGETWLVGAGGCRYASWEWSPSVGLGLRGQGSGFGVWGLRFEGGGGGGSRFWVWG